MKIDKITYQHRRDFKANFICEHCGNIEKDQWGYDDENFHINVIPNMKCKNCDKKSGDDYKPLSTKYPDGYQV